MDNALLISVIGLAVNVVVAVVVLASFLWRIPSKGDVKRVEDKADEANKQIQMLNGDIKVLSEKVERIEGFFDMPQLKSN